MRRITIPLFAMLLGVVVGVGGTRIHNAGYFTGCKADPLTATLRDGTYKIALGTTTTVQNGAATTCKDNRLW
jgi:hypothetical protein